MIPKPSRHAPVEVLCSPTKGVDVARSVISVQERPIHTRELSRRDLEGSHDDITLLLPLPIRRALHRWAQKLAYKLPYAPPRPPHQLVMRLDALQCSRHAPRSSR